MKKKRTARIQQYEVLKKIKTNCKHPNIVVSKIYFKKNLNVTTVLFHAVLGVLIRNGAIRLSTAGVFSVAAQKRIGKQGQPSMCLLALGHSILTPRQPSKNFHLLNFTLPQKQLKLGLLVSVVMGSSTNPNHSCTVRSGLKQLCPFLLFLVNLTVIVQQPAVKKPGNQEGNKERHIIHVLVSPAIFCTILILHAKTIFISLSG